jgi:hypothetical protein
MSRAQLLPAISIHSDFMVLLCSIRMLWLMIARSLLHHAPRRQ